MIEKRYGRIVNIARFLLCGLFEVAAYSASKAAVASLTKSLAIEWAGSGVVSMPSLRLFRRTECALLDGTERAGNSCCAHDAQVCKIEDWQARLCFFASDAASFVTVTY